MNQRIINKPKTDHISIVHHAKKFFAECNNIGNMPEGSTQVTDKFVRINAGVEIPLFNSLFHLKTAPNKFKEGIIEEEKFFAPNPFTLWLDEYSLTDEIENVLKQRNYQSGGDYHGMLFTFTDQNIEALHNMELPVKVKSVFTMDEADIWYDIISQVFGVGGSSKGRKYFDNMIHNALKTHRTTMSFCIGYLDDKPVGAGQVYVTTDFNGDKVGGLWCGSVLPEARNKGVGLAMGLYRMLEAYKMGAQHMMSLLESQLMAKGYIEKLGFKSAFVLKPYFGPMPAP